MKRAEGGDVISVFLFSFFLFIFLFFSVFASFSSLEKENIKYDPRRACWSWIIHAASAASGKRIMDRHFDGPLRRWWTHYFLCKHSPTLCYVIFHSFIHCARASDIVHEFITYPMQFKALSLRIHSQRIPRGSKYLKSGQSFLILESIPTGSFIRDLRFEKKTFYIHAASIWRFQESITANSHCQCHFKQDPRFLQVLKVLLRF